MGMFFLYKYIARNLLKHLLLTFYAHRHNHMPITDQKKVEKYNLFSVSPYVQLKIKGLIIMQWWENGWWVTMSFKSDFLS